MAELFSDSIIPPVQLPLDYSSHIKQRTLPMVTAKTVKRVKQESRDDGGGIEDMDTAESSTSSSKLVKPAKPPVSAEVKSHQVTAAELFTPCEVCTMMKETDTVVVLIYGGSSIVLWRVFSTAVPTHASTYDHASNNDPSLEATGSLWDFMCIIHSSCSPSPLSPVTEICHSFNYRL